MPLTLFALILLTVILAGGATVWLITLGGPAVALIALPAALIAVLAVRRLRR